MMASEITESIEEREVSTLRLFSPNLTNAGAIRIGTESHGVGFISYLGPLWKAYLWRISPAGAIRFGIFSIAEYLKAMFEYHRISLYYK